MYFSAVYNYIDIAEHSSAMGLPSEYSGQKCLVNYGHYQRLILTVIGKSHWFAVEFFTRGLHRPTCTAIPCLPLRQLGFHFLGLPTTFFLCTPHITHDEKVLNF